MKKLILILMLFVSTVLIGCNKSNSNSNEIIVLVPYSANGLATMGIIDTIKCIYDVGYLTEKVLKKCKFDTTCHGGM